VLVGEQERRQRIERTDQFVEFALVESEIRSDLRCLRGGIPTTTLSTIVIGSRHPMRGATLIIDLTVDQPPSIDASDGLGGLTAVTTGPLDAMQLAPVCYASADGQHIWVEVAALRAASAAAGFGEGFEAMIDYARSKGWLDEDGTHVRAHVDSRR
jgi:hypothetical protein